MLFVDNTFTFGGAITSLAHLVKGLEAHPIVPFVVSGQNQAYLDRLFPTATNFSLPSKLPWVHGDPFVPDPAQPNAIARLGFLPRLARSLYWFINADLSSALRIAKVARKHRVDIIHLNNSWQVDGALASSLLGIPCVAHARGFLRLSEPELAPNPIINVLRRAFFRLRLERLRPSMTLPVSGAVAKDLLDQGLSDTEITVVHDAIDLSQFTPGHPPPGLRAELGIEQQACVIGLFGRVIPWKGTLEFLEAFKHVVEGHPHARALIVGDVSDGSEAYSRSVVTRVAHLGLKERVLFAGFREDVANLMRACDLVAHTSIEPEPFGMVVAEAMATAAPVVAANAGGPLEIVRDGIDGFLADPRDPAMFGEKMAILVADPMLRAKMGARARERVESKFSKERYAHDVVGVYERILSRRITQRPGV